MLVHVDENDPVGGAYYFNLLLLFDSFLFFSFTNYVLANAK